jgi:hypothetical protein
MFLNKTLNYRHHLTTIEITISFFTIINNDTNDKFDPMQRRCNLRIEADDKKMFISVSIKL